MTCIKDECYLRDLLWQEAKQSSQKELAAKIKISPQYLSDIMGGNRAVPDVVARYYGYHGFMALCGWRLPPDSAVSARLVAHQMGISERVVECLLPKQLKTPSQESTTSRNLTLQTHFLASIPRPVCPEYAHAS